MMSSHNFDEQFDFKGKAKSYSLIAIAVGVIGILYGFISGNVERTFANLLLCSYYFVCICISGIFFCAIQFVAQAGWSAAILRIPQAFGKTLPIAAVVLFLVIVAGLSFTHSGLNEEGKQAILPYLYKFWALKGSTTLGDSNYNANIAAKSGWLNHASFLCRIAFYLVSYSFFGWLLNKYSTNEDELGGMSNYKKSFNIACVFLVIFGFTVPLFAFDTIMSLEAHWFSTMFGWYNFAALWVSGIAAIALTIIYLKEQGYAEWITEDHLHNLGQLIFGFSIFWTYLWFAQFLLIWYANIPEEVAYFYRRWEPQFKPWFWFNIVINFLTPLLVLMSRDAKRKMRLMKVACIILICGHWVDYFQMIMPGTVGPQTHWYTEVGFVELSIFAGFAGLFTFTMLTSLSKFKSLIPKKHPLLGESLHHHI